MGWFFSDGAQEVYSKKGPGKGDQIQKWHQVHQQREREREVRESINAWNHNKIQEAVLQKSIKWNFNSPYGSHYGGVWERRIWTTCKVSWTLLQTQTDDHEGLVTLLCEVESIINGRPITTVLGASNGPEPLMPNHLLLLCSEPQMPPGLFQKEDFSWHRWRQVQYPEGIFWKWWSKEYLPLLQSRQKWTTIRKNLAVVLVSAEDSRQNRGPWVVVEVCWQERFGASYKGESKRNSFGGQLTNFACW